MESNRYSTTFKASPIIADKFVEDHVPIPGYQNAFFFGYDLGVGKFPEWLQFPVVYRQYEGKRIYDIIETTYGPTFLISDYLLQLLEIEKLNGWSTYPIILLDKKGNEISGYHGFCILGHGGDYKTPPEKPINMLTRADRMYDIRQWDGSDFFTIGGAFPCVSERAMKVLKPLVRWMYFTPIISTDFFTVVGIE